MRHIAVRLACTLLSGMLLPIDAASSSSSSSLLLLLIYILVVVAGKHYSRRWALKTLTVRKNEILGVQSLRNSMLAATLVASSVLSVGFSLLQSIIDYVCRAALQQATLDDVIRFGASPLAMRSHTDWNLSLTENR
jgi:predicted benzoate:H+ symporter BenE